MLQVFSLFLLAQVLIDCWFLGNSRNAHVANRAFRTKPSMGPHEAIHGIHM